MKTKFAAGDVVVREAYKDSKSAMLRDEMTIVDVVSDEHPICPKVWYVCKDCRGRIVSGLVGVVDECFIKA